MAKPKKVEQQDEVQSEEMTFNPSLEDQINIIREKMDNAKKNAEGCGCGEGSDPFGLVRLSENWVDIVKDPKFTEENSIPNAPLFPIFIPIPPAFNCNPAPEYNTLLEIPISRF